MLCDHCGDCYELLTDLLVLNQLSNLFGGKWTAWVCAGYGHLELDRSRLSATRPIPRVAGQPHPTLTSSITA